MTSQRKFPPLFEPIRSHLEQVEVLLQERVAQLDEPLRGMLSHALSRGKRLRPALVLFTGELFARPPEPFYRLAAAAEMLHTATLVHDDIVDQSHLRRGKKTLHTLWPVRETVLAGDHLLAQAAVLVAQLNPPAVLDVFAKTLAAICAGEIRQTFVNEGRHRSREEYYRSIEAKTASLVVGAVEMAGLLAKASEVQIAALRNFGKAFGLAFQIADDVLDFVGTEEELGKLRGSDLRQGLITLPTLCYLEEGGNEALVEAVLSGKRDNKSIKAVMSAICASGAIEAAIAEARRLAEQGQQALLTLPNNWARQRLHALSDFVVSRTY